MKLNVADYLSLSRIPLTVMFLFFAHDALIAMILLALVIITDVLDGFIARKFYKPSKFGGVIDPLCDKVFIVSSFVIYIAIGRLNPAFFLPLVLRDIYSVAEIIHIHVSKSEKFHKANIFGKLTTAFQYVMIAILIIDIRFLYLPVVIAVGISAVLTMYTYARRFWK
jgi:CDP-diacylglycerol--glycerol-3-phosphate 3-phosphatidyltransferase